MQDMTYDRYLSPLDVWAIAFGCTIGWGAFMMPGSTFLPVAGPLGAILGIAIGALIMLVVGANISFLMKQRPGTGGVYGYTKEVFGRDHAFLCAWFLVLSYLTILFLNATSLFLVIRMVFGRRLQLGYNYYTIAGNGIFLGEVGASIVALAIIGLLFLNAKPLLQRLQTILAIVLLAGVVILGAVCIPHAGAVLKAAEGGAGGGPSGLWTMVMLAPMIFVGFEVISLETAHFDFRVQHSRWIALAAIAVSALVYIALTLVSVSAVPDGYASWPAYIHDLGNLDGIPAVPTFFAAKSILGSAGLLVVALAALAAILTGMIAAYRATTRVLSTMAEDRILSARFEETNSSIVFIMVICIIVSIFGRKTLECFMELTSLGAIIGFGYMSAGAWAMARRGGDRMHVVTGAVGTVASVVFGVVKLIPRLVSIEIMSANAFLLLAIWCLLGFLFYLRTQVSRRRDAQEAKRGGVTGLVLFALLLFSSLLWMAKRLIAAGSTQEVRMMLEYEGSIMLGVIFIALGVMMYIQKRTTKPED